MSDTESKLRDALAELDQAVRGMSASLPKPDLLSLFARIDALAAELPPAAEPMLAHFLRNKSYEKALQYLRAKGPAATPGDGSH